MPQAQTAHLPLQSQHRQRTTPPPPPPAHRQTAPGVAYSQKGVMITVAEVSRAACQLSPAAILTMVVGQGAIVHHHRDVREHTLRPRHRLLYGQPSFWKWQGHPPPQSQEAPLCWDQGEVPALSQLPSLPVLLYGREQGPTSVASSLGYVSRKMAKPWKLSLLPNTGPGMRKRCSSHGENWGCTLGSRKDTVLPVGARDGNLLVFHPRKRRDL